MKRVISIMAAGKEWARVVEGKFEILIESSVFSRTVLWKWYNDSFYDHKDASTFDQRFQLVKDKKYFCYSKPDLRLIARTFVCMTNPEIESLVETVYRKLQALLSLYVETDDFFEVPEGEEVSGSSGEDAALDFVERKISEIRKCVAPLLVGEEIAQKLNQIIDETEYFIKQCEVPGVVTRWKQINPQLIYFDCAFDLMENCPETYKEIRNGLTNLKLSCYPDAELLAERNAYFAKAKEHYEHNNLEYSEERIFQDELLHTLTLLFEDFFPGFKNSESLCDEE